MSARGNGGVKVKVACKWASGFRVRQRYQGSSIATSKLHGNSRNLTAMGDRQALDIYRELAVV